MSYMRRAIRWITLVSLIVPALAVRADGEVDGESLLDVAHEEHADPLPL